ncbi:MAG: calcium/sodium antiporter [Alphaproteobacteria bacterium]|nr:calcium/sodium antiporter [Alphaproteobacteria bacterium]
MLAFLEIIAGLILLVGGGDVLVKGAVALSKNLGVSSIVIGLTVVAFGTSAPELFISVQSAVDHPDIAIGNVLGSNIANVMLVIGATTLVMPVVVHKQMARRDGSVMMLITLLFVIWTMNGTLHSFEGGVLLIIVAAYTLYTIRDVRLNRADPSIIEGIEEETNVEMRTGMALLYCLGGVFLLSFGSEVLIEGAVTLAELIGLSKAVIGVTIIAVGGSTPELVTCLVAAFKRHGDIGLANVVGSNIFNLTAVIGAATMVAPLPIAEQFRQVDLWVLLGVTFAFFAAMLARKQIGRIEGVVMLVAYMSYVGWQYNIIA